MKHARYGKGPLPLRVLLVMSSMSPLFLLWAIRGTDLVRECIFWGICGFFLVAPNLYLGGLLWRARQKDLARPIDVGQVDDHRQDIISYLFAMLLPFYTVDLSTWRNLIATIVAFLIVVVLFTSLDLQYMNFMFAVWGYHCYSVRTPESDHAELNTPSFMVLSKKSRIRPDSKLTAHVVKSNFLIEARE